MTSYVMEAKENYSPTLAEGLDGATLPSGGSYYTDQACLGSCFDPVRRKWVYAVNYNPNGSTLVTNSTGLRLWSGFDTIGIGATYREDNVRNFNVLTKDIDTGAVTFYDAFDPTSLVPSGIGGSDGTNTGRFIEGGSGDEHGPKIVDPRTGNLWVHMNGGSCELHCLRLEDNYAQTLSPLLAGGMYVWGLSDSWFYVANIDTTNYNLWLTPRLRTSDETTADCLLKYADYDTGMAYDGLDGTITYATCAGGNQKLYLLYLNAGSAPWQWKLLEFTEPTSVVYPNAPVGGGWTDVTPWSTTGGPNTGTADWGAKNKDWSASKLMWLHGSSTLVVLNCLYPQAKTAPGTDPNDWSMRCGYYHPADAGWHDSGVFVTGYMTAAWEMTTDPTAAAYAIWLRTNDQNMETGLRFSDQYRDYNSYDYTSDIPSDNDTIRWFYFDVQPVSGGVIDTTKYKGVFAQYKFVRDSAPALQQFLPTQGWTDAYPTYAATVSGDVVEQSIPQTRVLPSLEPALKDDWLWDAGTSALWCSGEGWGVPTPTSLRFFQFDAAFSGRNTYAAYPPFMRLTFSEPAPPPAFRSMVWSNIGRPQI